MHRPSGRTSFVVGSLHWDDYLVPLLAKHGRDGGGGVVGDGDDELTLEEILAELDEVVAFELRGGSCGLRLDWGRMGLDSIDIAVASSAMLTGGNHGGRLLLRACEELILSFNSVGDCGAKAIAHVLPQLLSLTSVEMQERQVHPNPMHNPTHPT